MRYKNQIILIIFMLCACFSSFVFGKSKAELEIDKIIATHEEIKKYDDELNDCYQRLFNLYGLEEEEKLKREQIAWLKERNAYVTDSIMIGKKYRERVEILKGLFNKKVVDLVITDQSTIDMRDPTINQALHYCDLEICRLYALFFEYCRSAKTSVEIDNIKTRLIPLANELLPDIYDLEQFSKCLEKNEIDDAFFWLLTSPQHRSFKWVPSDAALVPLWLVFQDDKILEYLNRRWALFIKTSHSIQSLPAFKSMSALMQEMAHGRWVRTSYCRHKGSIYLDLNAADANFMDQLSYTPHKVKQKWPIEMYLAPLRAWSLEGIWNRLLFKKFEAAFTEATYELERYYKTFYNLDAYANQAAILLASYVFHSFPLEGIASHEAFSVFGGSHDTMEGLKEKTKNFNEEAWNEALSIAILNDYPLSVIEWIIDSGAQVNSTFMYESPLMKAVAYPEILRLLLNKGAKVDAQTPYGKTALFYAIQYGPLESVKILVERGANVNHSLKSLDGFKKVYNDLGEFFLLEDVAYFTPLVYSLGEESKEKMVFLLNHGATLGNSSKSEVKKWILMYSNINEEELNQRFASL